MSIFNDIYSNNEAAEYLTSKGYPVSAPMLSKITQHNLGPRFEKKGAGKFYRKEWLDEFLSTIGRNTTNEASNG